MRDPSEIFTPRGTPITVVFSRLLFVIYFIFTFLTSYYHYFPRSRLTPIWIFYLLILYYLLERVYLFYRRKQIDLTYAFPLLFIIYIFNLISMINDAQNRLPLINRAEHFISFVLLTYIVWIFFLKYLPQKVWREHPYYTALIVLSITSFFGVLNEIIELTLDVIFQTDFIGNRLDTPLDLIMNTLGACLFLAVWLILSSGFTPASDY